jgi:spore germination protein YaaH
MEKKIFKVNLYSYDWPTIYDDYVVKAESESAVEDAFDLDAWGAEYESCVVDETSFEDELEEEVDAYYASLARDIKETTVEELLEEGWTPEEIEKIEEI